MLTKASETVQVNGLQHDIQVSGRHVAVRITVSSKEISRDLSKYSAGLKNASAAKSPPVYEQRSDPEGPTEA